MTRKIDLIRQQIQRSIFLFSVFVLFSLHASAQKTRDQWVDSVFQTLNTEEKIGQLILVTVVANDESYQSILKEKIRSYHVGGVVITKAGPRKTVDLINKAQKIARVPLLFTADNTDSVLTFPGQSALNALTSDSLRTAVAQQVAYQKKLVGLHDLTSMKITNMSNSDFVFDKNNDLILDPGNVTTLIRQLKKNLKKNEPLQQQLDAAVKKVLYLKYDQGLAYPEPLQTANLSVKLNDLHARLLQQEVFQKSITLLKNQWLPIQSLENKKFASITIGKETANEFTHTLSKYVPFDHYDAATIDPDELNKYDYVIIGAYSMIMPSVKNVLQKITQPKILCFFDDPSQQLNDFSDINTILTTYANNPISEKAAAQMIFGALPFEGKNSITTPAIQRFSYVLPEQAKMDGPTLDQISYIVQQAIDSGATPGCHVLVAHKGKVVFDKSYGWYTYDNKIPVTDETIYDLASITKVAATLQAVMFLTEKGKIDINKKISVYLPELKSTNKKDITIKDMLTHQSGLLPFIPMWPNTVKDKMLMPYYYSDTKSDQYSMQVAPSLFVKPAIRDSAFRWVVNSKMTDRQPRTPYSYRYSDMASMLFQFMVERIINQPMNEFLDQNFYEPLGAGTLGFLPLEKFPSSQIAPTEIDTIFRKQLIHGTVHDERAAMLGGIAGHAGLFGDATDLAKLGQMLLNGGTYGGVRFFKKETVDMFTAKFYGNSRRGLGWDKPTGDWNGPTSELASPKTFGHTGFTGTCIWVDPEFDLVFVFLSNRVWPDRSNKLLNANIRPRIQEVVYKSLFNYCQFSSAGN